MILCKELNESFEDKKSLFAALKANKQEIINLKKAQIQKSYEKDTGIPAKYLDITKLHEAAKDMEIDNDFHYLAVNSTRVLDSHEDLHLDGIWNKTVKEQQGRNYLVLDHELKVYQTAVKKEDIEMFTAVIPFSMIGKSYEGETEALIYKFPKTKVINQLAKEWLESGDDIEASVRMQYVKIQLAMNSDEKGDEEEKKAYDSYLPVIANKEDFDEINYFWAVSEAKNVRESSLVLYGSNNATGNIKSTEPSKDTQKAEAVDSDTSLNTFYSHLNIN